MWFFRWKPRSCTILRFYVIKLKVSPRIISCEKTQSLHSLVVSQSTNVLDVDFSVAKQDKVDGYKPIKCPQKCCAILREKPFYWVPSCYSASFPILFNPWYTYFLKNFIAAPANSFPSCSETFEKIPKKTYVVDCFG